MIITIDGPAASGKSTVALRIATELGMFYLCSGLLYRACTYILRHYAGYKTEHAITHPSRKDIVEYCNQYRIRYVYTIHGIHIFFDKDDITEHLKTATIDHYVSLLSTHEEIRTEVHIMQKAIAQDKNLVADGRDMGSVAFPDAEYKFFLTASVEERARRWQKDQEKKDNNVSLQQAIEAITQRDYRDTTRAVSPLVVPAHAITIDNTNLTLDQTVQETLKYIKLKK